VLKNLQANVKKNPKPRQVVAPKFIPRVSKPVDLDDKVLNYVDSFKNLADLINTHDILKWD